MLKRLNNIMHLAFKYFLKFPTFNLFTNRQLIIGHFKLRCFLSLLLSLLLSLCGVALSSIAIVVTQSLFGKIPKN